MNWIDQTKTKHNISYLKIREMRYVLLFLAQQNHFHRKNKNKQSTRNSL